MGMPVVVVWERGIRGMRSWSLEEALVDAVVTRYPAGFATEMSNTSV
jgi:hypothetical protein